MPYQVHSSKKNECVNNNTEMCKITSNISIFTRNSPEHVGMFPNALCSANAARVTIFNWILCHLTTCWDLRVYFTNASNIYFTCVNYSFIQSPPVTPEKSFNTDGMIKHVICIIIKLMSISNCRPTNSLIEIFKSQIFPQYEIITGNKMYRNVHRAN
jgi:hypothetical protein